MRIEQVELQWQGLRAVLRPEVGNRLALTTVQIAGIRGMVAETDRMIARVRKQSREDKGRRAIEKQVKSMRKSESRRIHGRLNASQKLDWEKMIGRSFDLSRLGKGMKYKAPTLAGSTRWVNGSPTTRAALRGKVVVVHFYALA